MNVDWSATGAWMQAWAGFAQAAAVLFAAYMASNTFKSWRKQKIEERRIAIAEKVLSLSYSMKIAFSIIRSPMKSPPAVEDATINLLSAGVFIDDIDSNIKEKIIESQIILDRINSFTHLWNQIPEVIPIAAALLDQRVEKFLTEIWSKKISIEVAAEQYPNTSENDHLYTALVCTMWENRKRLPDNQDKLSMDISNSIISLEKLLFPVIRSDY
jgi:hypothetical protein